MNKKSPFILISLLLVFVSCGNLGMREPTITEANEYEIFNAIIDSLFSEQEFVHVVQTTSRLDSSNIVRSFLDESGIAYDSLMLVDYALQNDSLNFLDCSQLNDPAVGITSGKMMAYFLSSDSNDGWTGYYRDYPNSSGYIDFLRPGFNPSANMAILEFGQFSHYLAAQGYIAIMEKIDGEWKISHLLYTWVS